MDSDKLNGTPPPSFPMELSKSKKERSSFSNFSYMKPKITGILGNSPQEDLSNQVLVGESDKKTIVRRAWQPHNYRRYYDWKPDNFNPQNQPPTNPPDINQRWYGIGNGFRFKPQNHGKEFLFQNFNACNVLVKKNQVMVLNKVHEKQWTIIEGKTIEEIDNRIDELTKDLAEHCEATLKYFIQNYGGFSNFSLLKGYAVSEDSIKGDSFIDSIPAHMRIHDTFFKKVYPDKPEIYNGEAPTPSGKARIKQVIHNSVIHDFAPEIAEQMSVIVREFVSGLSVLVKIGESHSQVLGKTVEATSALAAAFTLSNERTLPTLERLHEEMAVHSAVMRNINEELKNSNAATLTLAKTLQKLDKKLIHKRKKPAKFKRALVGRAS